MTTTALQIYKGIAKGSVFSYTCKFTGQIITETVKEVSIDDDGYVLFSMDSCASYDLSDLKTMDFLNGFIIDEEYEAPEEVHILDEIFADNVSCIHGYGPSLSDATESMRNEYNKAWNELNEAGLKQVWGRIYAI